MNDDEMMELMVSCIAGINYAIVRTAEGWHAKIEMMFNAKGRTMFQAGGRGAVSEPFGTFQEADEYLRAYADAHESLLREFGADTSRVNTEAN